MVLLPSCINSRYVAEGEHVLYHNEVFVTMADSSEVTPEVREALKYADRYYLQDHNTRFLGIKWARISMMIYNISSPNDSSFWGKYWRRMGQAPVVYDESKARRTAVQLKRLLESKGCFNTTATFDTIELTKRNISIGYHLVTSHRYLVDEVVYHTSQPAVSRLLSDNQSDSPLKVGDPYDQDNLAAERDRIVNTLRNAGYYHASPDLVSFLVDTTYDPRKLSIDVFVNDTALRVFHINNIYIYPNSTAGLRNHGGRTEHQFDTLIYTYPYRSRRIDYQFVYDKPMTLNPQTISRAMLLFPGMTYRPRYVSNTYNSLLNLRNFKYINVEFSPSKASTDTLPLVDAHVRLINSSQQKISLSLELTNASPIGRQDSGNFVTSGNLGIETSLEYQHKNLFGGAELLKVKGSLLLELPKLALGKSRTTFRDNFSAFETNLEASLDMPVFLLPLSSGIVWQRTHPHTLISLSGSYQYHYYFERILAGTSFGYTWSSSQQHAHQLLPLEFTFVRMLNLDNDFAARLQRANDLRLTYQYSSHFIMDARYDYSFSNQQYGIRKDFNTLHFSIETAGNLLAAANALSIGTTDSNGVRQILGVPYAQYVRFFGEYSRYLHHGSSSSFIIRTLLGIGIPYGNSLSMPYEKSFFGGGPTTMRAWQLRHLGPGSFQGGDNLLERIGDLQLVLNLEERFPLFGIFEGALFADIGNVWLFNASEQYPGGEIQLNRLLSDIAVGVGLGIRLNVSIATLRFDFGLPLYDPGYSSDQRFRLPHWSFSQLVTNIGIGYPF